MKSDIPSSLIVSMFAFLRSNLYPASIRQQPELKSRIDALRFLLVSNSAKIRENTKQGKSPLSEMDVNASDPTDAAINVAALSEIMLKELRFCHHTILFVSSVTAKFHEAAFDNTDRYIGNIECAKDLEKAQVQEEQEEQEFTSEQNHSSRLLASSSVIRSKFIALCGSLGIDVLSLSDLDECSASTDSSLFAAIHASLSSLSPLMGKSVTTPFETLCNISRAVWQLMNVLAFSNLYRYHYEFQKTPVARVVDLNPADSVFATR